MGIPTLAQKTRAVAPHLGNTPAVPRAMILAAGFGTRLRPLTDELPKPLLPIGDRSLLEHALAAYEQSGLGAPVLVNVHHLAQRFQQLPAELAARIELIFEPEIRGTAGGIAGARDRLGPGPVAVTIGDVVLERVPPDFVERAGPEDLLLAVAPRPRGSGTVGVGADGAVVRLRGERFGEELNGGDYVGLAALGAGAREGLPDRGCLIQDYALPRLRRGERVSTATFQHRVLFPGDDLPGYLVGNLSWLSEQGLEHFVSPDAEVASQVRVERSIIGRGARVGGVGVVRGSVVLPGARAMAPLDGVIVAPSGRIVQL